MRKYPLAKCESCPLFDEETVPSTILADSTHTFVGEAPGASETELGRPFVGQSGQLLRSAFSVSGGDPDKASYINVVACRPPHNRAPSKKEIEACEPRFVDDLVHSNGWVVALGRTAHEALDVNYKDHGRWSDKNVLPTWHPSYVLRKPSEASSFLRDLQIAVRGPRKDLPDTEMRHVTTLAELDQALQAIPDGAWVSLDLETDQVNWYAREGRQPDPILMAQICWDPTFGIVADDALLYDVEGTIEVLRKHLSNKKIVGHNVKFDTVFLASHLGLHLDASFDTYLAHYLLDENLPHGLKELSKTELGSDDYEDELIAKYLTKRSDNYSKIPFEYLAKYGVLDTAATLLLRERYEKKLADEGMTDLMNNIIMPASNMLTDVELRGLKVDRAAVQRTNEELQADLDKRADELRHMSGFTNLNVDSPQQVAEVLYDYYDLPEINHWKIKPRSTSHGAIERYKDHPFVAKLLGYRRVAKMQRSYVRNLLKFMEDGTNRVHGDFRIPGTEVGRLSVRDPALQTIPRASEYYGALIRSMFIPEEGCVLVVVDYSQAELRTLGALAMEQFLIDVYRDDRDLHTEVAIAMFGETFTKEQRVMCKMFNFSYAYGGTERSFAEDAGLNINVAREFVKRYNQNMPSALAWKNNQHRIMLEEGEVQTIFGRKRRFPLITGNNKKDAMKASVHMPVASTANDLTLISMNRLRDLPAVLTVHDSILIEAPINEAKEMARHVVHTMESTGNEFLPQINWKAEAEIRDRWAPVPTRS